MMGKARAALLKQMTIPRLELAAAVLSVKLDKLFKAELHLIFQSSQFWIDSQAVLKHIANDSVRFPTFVANRVSFIRENSSVQQWKFINNPADDASRGLSVQTFLDNERWIYGPECLWKPRHTWPADCTEAFSLSQDDPEVSDLTKLVKVVTWYQRLGDSLLLLVDKRKQVLTDITTCSHCQNVMSNLHASKVKLGRRCTSLNDLERAERASAYLNSVDNNVSFRITFCLLL